MGDEWQKTICIDLDGTLAEYHGWTGAFAPIGEPLPGAWEFCRALRAAGWRIIIHTCRGDLDAVRDWLDANTIAYDGINATDHNAEGSSEKPIADVYLDDRAVRFEGDFSRALRQIGEAAPGGRDIADEVPPCPACSGTGVQLGCPDDVPAPEDEFGAEEATDGE